MTRTTIVRALLILFNVFALSVVTGVPPSGAAADDVVIRGRIVDAAGTPVEDVTVSSLWQVGTEAGRQSDDVRALDDPRVSTSVEGKFECKTNDRFLGLLAIDKSGRQGAVINLSETSRAQSTDVVLLPLVSVRFQFPPTYDSTKIKSYHVYVELPEVERLPLAITRIFHSESETGAFEFKLPPGRYVLKVSAYTDEQEPKYLELASPQRFTVSSALEQELGTLHLRANPDSAQRLVKLLRKAHAGENWTNLTDRVGQTSPEWHVSDSRGLDSKLRVEDFRGKWLLIEFWGLGCAPCITQSMPKLIDLYERHSDKREKFEIVGAYMDYSAEFASMRDLEKALAPVEKHVWRGKKIPFPIILDSSLKTWENFGLRSLGEIVLIDPNGLIVHGDEKTLEEILR